MKLAPGQVADRLSQVTGWELSQGAITAVFQFKDFAEAMQFVNRAADVAEALDHHPDMLIRYNSVQLTVFTHSEGGLTEKDFELAARVNQLR